MTARISRGIAMSPNRQQPDALVCVFAIIERIARIARQSQEIQEQEIASAERTNTAVVRASVLDSPEPGRGEKSDDHP